MDYRIRRLALLGLGVACAKPRNITTPAVPIIFAPGRGTLYVKLRTDSAAPLGYARMGLERGLARFEGDSVPLVPGDYAFRDVPVGRYALVVHRIAYIRLTDSVTIHSGQVDTIRLSMRLNFGCDIGCGPALHRSRPWWKF